MRNAKRGGRPPATEINDLRQEVRSGLENGSFASLYLWIRFWADGGSASRAHMEAFVHGLQDLSDKDVRILGAVVEEMLST